MVVFLRFYFSKEYFLKQTSLFIMLFFATHIIWGQNLYLELKGFDERETQIIDSIAYEKSHLNIKSIIETINQTTYSLTQKGFITSEIIGNSNKNDSTFVYQIKLGQKTNFIYVVLNESEYSEILFEEKTNDTLKIAFYAIEKTLQKWLRDLELKGYSLSNLQLTDYRIQNGLLLAHLKIETQNKRILNSIVFNGFPKFPSSHKKQLLRQYKNKTFNQKQVQKLYDDINRFYFVKQFKYPEILFTTDSTDVYVYMAKANANRFEGFVGFGNDDQDKVRFNGYLDLELTNIFNSGEKTSLYWKSDGREQTTFNIATELPYIFQTPFALKASLNLFKQDSTFQNSKTNLELGYLFAYNKRAYFGYQSSSSNDIQNTNSASLQDFKNEFFTQSFEYTQTQNNDLLFAEQTFLEAKIGFGQRRTATSTTDQQLFQLKAFHLFYLNEKNIIYLKTENYMLISNEFFTNELYRFGGINSIRGFNENSLQANVVTSLMTEYRLKLGEELYVHSLFDYGYFSDEVTQLNANIFSFGFGLGLKSKNGLFNLIYANGASENQPVKLSNAIVHVSFKARF